MNIKDIWYRANSLTEKKSKIASLKDCEHLYNVVCRFKPKVIVEVGTWIGTTSFVMAQAQIDSDIKGMIYTCDKHKEFKPWEEYPNIKYYNMFSYDFLKKINHKKIDFCFADARLFKKDCKTLYKMYRGKAVFMTHDFFDRKGKRNFEYMVELFNTKAVENRGTGILLYE